MKKRDIRVYVEDILESISKIEEYTKTATEEDFYKSTQIRDAVLRRLEIMGESVKNLPLDFRNEHPEIRWKNIAGMRDILIHAYSGVDLKRVWKVIKVDIPNLKSHIMKIRKNMVEENSA